MISFPLYWSDEWTNGSLARLRFFPSSINHILLEEKDEAKKKLMPKKEKKKRFFPLTERDQEDAENSSTEVFHLLRGRKCEDRCLAEVKQFQTLQPNSEPEQKRPEERQSRGEGQGRHHQSLSLDEKVFSEGWKTRDETQKWNEKKWE